MLRVFDYEKLPVVEVVNEIIYDAAVKGASDIHFDPIGDIINVRIRIDGELIEYTSVPSEIKKNLVTRIKIIAGMNITELRLPQDGAIKTTIKEKNIDLRVSCLPTHIGEKIVVRILDYGISQQGLENLGFSDNNFNKLVELIEKPNGIILVTGATGSGKSTTVYSVLQRLNQPDVNLITVEDPVEMGIDGISQIQVNSEIGLDFANVLRSILRQDPDIIMVGEIRDSETAKIAVRASITGHLVLSTLHTNNALNTIERLIDMDVERYLLSSALEGIVSQKLARRLCTKCKVEKPATEYEKDICKKVLGHDIQTTYKPGGCPECNNGYRGRIAIHEILVINEKIRNAISENVGRERLRELVYSSDVTTMLVDGLEKAVNGITTFEEILKLIDLEDDLDTSYNLNAALYEATLAKSNKSNVTNNSYTSNNEISFEEVKPTVSSTTSSTKYDDSTDSIMDKYSDLLNKYSTESTSSNEDDRFSFTQPSFDSLGENLNKYNI